jgi:drug/metabolite transporter (DMT)-like permease
LLWIASLRSQRQRVDLIFKKTKVQYKLIMISNEHRGSLYAILSGLLYGFVGYFGVSAINESISVTNMLFWRFLIASLIIVFIIIFQLKRIPYARKDMVTAFMNGAVFYGLSSMIYFYACPYIGSGLAMVIFFTYPAMIMLLNYFLYGNKIPTVYYFSVVIFVGGMCLFVDINEVRFDIIGIVLSIVSAMFYAGYIVSSKQITALHPYISTLMVCLGCTTTCLFLSLMNHSLIIPSTLHTWANLFGIGIISTTAPILLLLYSLNYISSEKTAILSVLEPVFVLIFGITLLDEPMKLQYVFGVIIVLAGALLTLFSQHKPLGFDNIVSTKKS